MYKIFEVTYNDGGWYSGDLPHFLYIAKNEEDVVANSKKYQEYFDLQKKRGGSVWIKEVSGLMEEYFFENLEKFDIMISVRKKH